MASLDPPPAKVPRQEIDFQLCIICQEEKQEPLVDNPLAHDKVLEYIRKRAFYGDRTGDNNFPDINRKLSATKEATLQSEGASWHRKCYQETVHIGMCERAKLRYEKQISAKVTVQKPIPLPAPTNTYTRSQSAPYDSNVCFFCETTATRQQPLHTVRTDIAGWHLHSAIEKSNNEKYRVKLSTAINPKDAHAIDIQYHNKCWTSNVTNVLRERATETLAYNNAADEVAADLEFITLFEQTLLEGKILNMSYLHSIYIDIRSANCVQLPQCHRKKVKDLIAQEIPGVEFHKSKRRNESENVSIKDVRDAAIQIASDSQETDLATDMKILFQAANILRRAILKTEKWNFKGSLTDVTDAHVPKELYTFFRWVLQGTKSMLAPDSGKTAVADRNAQSLAQTTVYLSLSERQRGIQSDIVRYQHEMPQQLGIGVAIRQAIRSKKVINLLHGFGVSVGYDRLLRLETQIANTILQRMQENEGVYMPSNVVLGRFIYFAIDNADFAEDTPNGKNTLHGTVMAMYQRREPEDPVFKVKVAGPAQMKSMKELPKTVTELLPCQMPKQPKPPSPVYPMFNVTETQPLSIEYKHDLPWLLGQALSRKVDQGRLTEDDIAQVDANDDQDDKTTLPEATNHIPTWAAYNSIVSKKISLTYVNTPPMIAAPAHEWKTLLTVLKQAQHITTKVIGPGRKTVITLDMGLYKPAKQLQMARDDCNHLILRPGELHTVMAQLRTIGSFIENSGLDLSWVEADLYGPLTVKQILEGKHVKRGIQAHLTTLQALFMLYADAFFKECPAVRLECSAKTDILNTACKDGDNKDIQRAHTELVNTIETLAVVEKMKKFDEDVSKKPLPQAICQYMQMVLEMTTYIRAVRTGDWQLHLHATEVFIKYYFAHDKLNYARLIPLYMADMKALAQSDPATWAEFMQGNWVVNKNDMPFCAIGPDHALEQVNRTMKVSGGLIGITQNPGARTKFFLVAPELACLADEAKQMAGLNTPRSMQHHDLTDAKLKKQEKNVAALYTTITNFTNPFDDECNQLINIVTKAIMPDRVQQDISRRKEIGSQKFAHFVSERIKSNNLNLWAPMKKTNLQMWSATGKKIKVKAGDKIVELKEDRALFVRLLVISKARPEVNLKEAVGKYEFSVVPRALFGTDGSLLLTSSKSELMAILEDLPKNNNVNHEANPATDVQPERVQKHVAVVDGMADLQSLDKPEWIKCGSDLADHFIARHWRKYNDYDEVHLVFDRYDIADSSLKTNTREKRLAGSEAVAYHITDSTSISHVSMKSLLAHTKTKDNITTYLAEKMTKHGQKNRKHVVVAWRDQAKGTHRDVTHLASTQEEADTKIILHAVDATANGATSVRIHSPDTDVLVLAIRRFPSFCRDTSFVTGTGEHRRVIQLEPIYKALGPNKAAALPGFHAFSGADITGRFVGKGKPTCWKVFKELDVDTLNAFALLGATDKPSETTIAALERYICKLYLPQSDLSDLAQVRWWLFKKKQAQAEALPPTHGALLPAISRAHFQAMIWINDIVANPELPPPQQYGWDLIEGCLKAVLTPLPPAPTAVIHLVKCSCAKTRCSSNRCKCKQNGLNCTELCNCSDDGEPCENACQSADADDDKDDDSDDDNDE